jgi:hypothetical protein
VAGSEWSAAHRRRLREVWRSAGWPCHDGIELDLLAAGLLLRQWDAAGRETLRLSDAGLAALAASRRRSQSALGAHEALVERVVREMQRAGRLAWRGLSLRAPLPGEQGSVQWVVAMPDVYSIRHTTVEAYTEPVAHEIKVSRADLLSDLRRPAKGAAYRALASQCWYVLRRGIAEPDEVPAEYGVMLADAAGLEVARAAPRRAAELPFQAWMALARANAEPAVEIDAQGLLGEPGPESTALSEPPGPGGSV